ncbi:uncharacterized protein C12orf56 homolog isoform X1 [Cyprinus carpio]|uniref:Uncharacterized protein C12orf56 homolog isoform X1 n=1 Tax=Cyprinus carpio TaxID=7962 RepID=A0A9Q9V9H2_CYPCA|nr:uncharacterized protein C12orf56 homolog isoform X1 [Cyprinus carpio]
MTRTRARGLLRHNNSKLDSFLKRNTSRDVYERIRVYEPCVVKKVFMHVILSDERVYLSEYQPRALREALSFRHIKSIELISSVDRTVSAQCISLWFIAQRILGKIVRDPKDPDFHLEDATRVPVILWRLQRQSPSASVLNALMRRTSPEEQEEEKEEELHLYGMSPSS